MVIVGMAEFVYFNSLNCFMTELSTSRQRIQSIDILRGIVMVIMALDHVRDYFHSEAWLDSPTNMATTTPVLFFTRWITHYCAPVFVFLAGTSAFLMGQRKTKQELSRFLLTRGIWLVFVEVAIVTLGITFDPLYHVLVLQVIWAIGMSMIILGLLVRFSFKVILIYGLIMVLGHNLLDYPEADRNGQVGWLWNILHMAQFYFVPYGENRGLLFVYAFLPWSGVMALGYCFGTWFRSGFSPDLRKKILLRLGIGLVLLFIALRFLNAYGDPVQWGSQERGAEYTFLSFLNVTKYPPSLMFLCMTIGPAIILLALMENIRITKVASFFRTFGRVPFFYYVIHFYLIHLFCVIAFFLDGRTTAEIIDPNSPFLFRPPDFGFGLGVVYAVWIGTVLLLYPVCRRYEKFKERNRKWWVSYL